ncbi:putative bifunctional diguanylate cyclase/phosphodiesterase [Salinimonas sediminis]|uniref:Bifunctional diguanylate cyclase/phosphodiesterase n=1 Tax=Salinimonas sediminis TaxID=2303538 RepID=A0A346NRW7_9ALTE|nr:bifunctional diguanylate cyclase/phosphodiesterase [Salinimonas sediminis]AXR08274.1 bifunctional diguanylate cyclase/phosphodiesterase [Salinimonas sediminis]
MQVKLSFLTKVMLLLLLMMACITAVISSLLIRQSNTAIDTQHQVVQQQNMRRYALLNTLLTDRILLWTETFTQEKSGAPASVETLQGAIEGARSSMDVSLQIDNVWLFDSTETLIYGDPQAMPGFVSDMRTQALQTLRPQMVTSCAHLCRRYIASPVMTQNEQPAVMIFATGMQELLALLSRSADVGRIAIARGTDNAASMEVISRLSVANKRAVTAIIQGLPANTAIDNLTTQGSRVVYEGRLLLVSLLPVLDGRLPDSYILFARDITEQVRSASAYQNWVVGSAVALVAVFAILLYLILNQYRARLMALSRRLPLLAEHRYDDFSRSASRSRPLKQKRLTDELDVLEDAASNLARELETIDSKIALTTAQLENMAMFDVLTGLPNRNMLMFQMEKEISLASRADLPLGLLFLDLDDFKRINDSHGHDVGDKLIQAAASRISEPLRDSDIAARFGGDEFVILLPGLNTIDQVEVVATRLIAAFEAPIQFDNHQFYVSISIGLAFCNEGEITAMELLRHADIAMYEAKAEQGSAYCKFDGTMNQRVMRRVELEKEARIGLNDGQFSLALQPQLSLETRRLVGFEALLRWHHPEKGNISPAEFIPLLENTSLMMTIDYWVVEKALSLLSELRERGYDEVKMAINISAAHFLDPALPEFIARQLDKFSLPPALIELELTETALVADISRASATLETIRSMGCMIAIDDFGTGYSSLGYLKALPADFIKIDRSFVSGMLESDDDRSIVASTVSMVRGMGLTVVAEGIETMAQYNMLDQFGCHQGQGYLFSPPIPQNKLWDQLNKSLDAGVWKLEDTSTPAY